MKILRRLLSVLLMCFILPVQAEGIRVAAAANLRYVLPELAAGFEKQSGYQLAISYAASGTLTTQIQHGAPFDVFLSASPSYIERLVNAELTEGKPVNYAQAQLVLFASHHSSLNIQDGLLGLTQALKQGVLNKIAIANPRHAPYGKAAQTELEALGVWKKIQDHLLMAENASQAVQFALSSSVDAGFVPYGHVIQKNITSKGRFIVLDETLQQQAILVNGSSAVANNFLNYLQSQQAKIVFLKYGFL